MRPAEPQYDVALSFAGEDRTYVEAVASELRSAGVKIFYDDYEKVALWGKDLYAHLDYVYRQASRYCVVFISDHYAKKVWTNHERQSAQARALEENEEYILPVRFDDTEVPGLRPTTGFLSLTDIAPTELAGLVREKLGPRRLTPGFPEDVTRLYQQLGLKGEKAKKKKTEARRVSYALYLAMKRMTLEERKAVAGVLAFGCPGYLPQGVHVSLDLLSRMTRMPKVQLLEVLTAVRALGVHVQVRKPPIGHDHELVPDDQDILLSFWAAIAPDAQNPTKIAQMAVGTAAGHFCEDHGLSVVTGLDFHCLSSQVDGFLTMDEEAGGS